MSDWEIDPIFGCWLWRGRVDRDGYPVTRERRAAHRAVYEELIGPIAAGLVLDHLCRRRRCVNPDHLEAITGTENQQRKRWRVRARRATCRRGHDLSVNGIVTENGGRVCRACNRERNR